MSTIPIQSDKLWDLYTTLHDAQVTTEVAIETLDAWLRQALLTDWVRQSAERLTLLGVRQVVFMYGRDQTITVQMDALE